ncbi:hypothetical protein D5S17_23470 [Pseudonocardiaceae bacterium YIM PH 21723]|nr:hypothetical protein D5S17_23470 [Pseudonocardiaceae bacterium YIM PH 21723]
MNGPVDPDLPLSLQAASLRAEIDANAVFQNATRKRLDAGDMRAVGQLKTLKDLEQKLRNQLQLVLGMASCTS